MKRMKPLLAPLCGFALLVLVFSALAACASPAAQLQGSYQVTITEAEIPMGFGLTNLTPDDVAILSGEWQINFLADGIFTVAREGEAMIEEGHYTVAGDLVTVGEERGPAACVGPPARVEEPGVYQWSLRAGQLVLLPADDKCGGRLIVFSALPWAQMQ